MNKSRDAFPLIVCGGLVVLSVLLVVLGHRQGDANAVAAAAATAAAPTVTKSPTSSPQVTLTPAPSAVASAKTQ